MPDSSDKRSPFQGVLDFLRRMLGKKPPGETPMHTLPISLRRGPKGRSGAAVAEIEDDSYRSFAPRRQ